MKTGLKGRFKCFRRSDFPKALIVEGLGANV